MLRGGGLILILSGLASCGRDCPPLVAPNPQPDALTTALTSIGFTRLAAPRPGIDAGTIIWLENSPAGLSPTIVCPASKAYPGLGSPAPNPTASQSISTVIAQQYSVDAGTLSAIKASAEYRSVDQISIRFTKAAVPEFAVSDFLTARARRDDRCAEAIRGQSSRPPYVVLRAFRASVAYDVILKEGVQAQLSVTALQLLASRLGVAGSRVSESSRSIEGDDLTWGVAAVPLSTIETDGSPLSIRPAVIATTAEKLAEAASRLAAITNADSTETQLAVQKLRILEERVGPASPPPACPGGEKAFDGSTEITLDTIVACQRIVFRRGASIRVKNGAALFFNANEIVSEGQASIDGVGEPGSPGSSGAPPAGEWSSQGDTDYWNAVRDCRNNPNHPDRGRQGGPGGRGGPGAVVVFGARPEGDLAVRVSGGAGGSGGPGSPGRLLKNGRQNYCDGCTSNCPAGPPGPPGLSGVDGRVITLAR